MVSTRVVTKPRNFFDKRTTFLDVKLPDKYRHTPSRAARRERRSGHNRIKSAPDGQREPLSPQK